MTIIKKSESIVNLVKATVKVMSEVKGIEKNLTVGTGNSSYQGVGDQDVKKIIGEAMERNGLAMFPIGIDETTNVDSWDEPDQYAKIAGATKRKQSVFTKVKTTYLLTHESGEFIEICGFGHGVDSQDKSAGKATTYALKYAMLYTFLVPTGKIDDADNTHSDDIKPPVKQAPKQTPAQPEVKWVTEVQFNKVKELLMSGEPESIEKGKTNFKALTTAPFAMKKEYKAELEAIIKNLEAN